MKRYSKLKIEPDVVVIEDICIASISLVQGIAFTKELDLSYQISAPDLTIRADARRLKQILVNLLSNAIKFTPNGGQVSLNITADEQKKHIKFVVTDNGIGIAQNEVEKLFLPFSQLDSSLSRQFEGSGLGLALVKRLVELHHGEVTVESKGIPGEGSRFTVILPMEDDSALHPENAEKRFASTSLRGELSDENSTSGSAKRKLILLAEDNQANRITMSEYLNIAGFDVILAENGQEAVAKATAKMPELILMDIQMPVMNGLDAIRQLRQDKIFKDMPILALTALAMPGDHQRCLDAGATGYITKPVKLKDLVQKIKTSLEPTG